jgi:hypothetical protein
MNRVKQLEKQIAELTVSELKAFREWFDRYEADLWDRQIEADAKSGKLSRLVERAIQDHEAGHSTKL